MTAQRPLFRPEAIEAQGNGWLGQVQRAQPLSVTLLTVAALLMAAVTLVFLHVGHYTRRVAVDGILVQSRAPIAQASTRHEWQAWLYVPPWAIAEIRPGQSVPLRLHTDPAARFGSLPGRVVQVSPSPTTHGGPPVARAPSGPAATGETWFRVTVEIDAGPGAAWPQPLVAGWRVQADLVLERRRLVDWLLAPMPGQPGRS